MRQYQAFGTKEVDAYGRLQNRLPLGMGAILLYPPQRELLVLLFVLVVLSLSQAALI